VILLPNTVGSAAARDALGRIFDLPMLLLP